MRSIYQLLPMLIRQHAADIPDFDVHTWLGEDLRAGLLVLETDGAGNRWLITEAAAVAWIKTAAARRRAAAPRRKRGRRRTQREVVLDRYPEPPAGKTFKEIADDCGVSTDTARRAYRRKK